MNLEKHLEVVKIPWRHKLSHLLGINMPTQCFKYECASQRKEKEETKK